MPTNVTYKGNLLTTINENQAKILKTKGTYLEDDVTITNTETSIQLQNKNIIPTESQQTITADSGYTGLGTITVNAIPSDYLIPSGNIDITNVGVTNVTNYATATVSQSQYELVTDHYFETVDGVRKFKVRAELTDRYNGGFIFLSPYEAKLGAQTIFNAIGTGTSITPTESSQTIGGVNTPTMLEGIVTINAIPLDYVGSGIDQRSSSDLTVSGATVTVPAGYYENQTSKSVSTGSATGPSSLSGSSATITTGTNTLTLTKTGITTTPTVSAGYVSAATASTATVTLTANVTTKAAATITPSTTNQTIASGTYLTGTQTIAGDSDLIAANIKTGVSIFNTNGTFTSDATASAADILSGETAYVNGIKVTGSLNIHTVYTGSSAPASNLGSNGDIYLQE